MNKRIAAVIKKIRVPALVVLAAMSCLSSFAGADEQTTDLTMLSIEELMNIRVFSASRYEQSVSEAPSSVTVVTADEIKHYGHRSLADILRSVRGFSMTYDRVYSYVGVRGVGSTGEWNSRILLLINGHRINENVYDSSMIGNAFPLDIDLIDRIEIIRGPGSSLYGDNAFFAVINVITRNGRDLNGIEASADAGSLKTTNGRMSYGAQLHNGGDLLLSASVLDSQGNETLYYKEFDKAFDSSLTTDGIVRNLDRDRNKKFFSRFISGDLILEGSYSERAKQVPTASYGAAFNDPRYEDVEGRSYLDLGYNRTFGSGLKVRSRIFYDWYWYHSDTPYYNGIVLANVLNKDIGKAHWWGAEAQVEKNLGQTHHLLAGADYQRTPEALLQNYDIAPYDLNCDITRSLEKWSAFLQDEVRITTALMLNAGVRYDHYSTFGGTANPRAALNFTPHAGTAIKLLYGNAFRAPNAYELYFDSPAMNSEPNPTLEPERIKTIELVYEQQLADSYNTAITMFQNKIRNLISPETDPANGFTVYKNIGDITAKGIEAELEKRTAKGVNGKVSYTYTRAHDDNTGKVIENSPMHMAKVNLTFPMLHDTMFLGLETQYAGSRETLTGQKVSAYTITNLTLLSKALARGLELSGSLYNVFDKKYSDPGGSEHTQDSIEQDGRGYRVKLAYRF